MDIRQFQLDEIEHQFGMLTDRRAELYQRFKTWLAVAQSTLQLRRVWIFGSFVSGKTEPGDLDVLALFAEGFDPANLKADVGIWFDHEICREINEIDLFFMTESTPKEAFDLIIETFRYNRTGQETLAEVTL